MTAQSSQDPHPATDATLDATDATLDATDPTLDPTLDPSALLGGPARTRPVDADGRVPLKPDMGFPRVAYLDRNSASQMAQPTQAGQAGFGWVGSPTELDLHLLGRRLRELREARDWSRALVASLSGGAISASALGTYERGERTVTASTLLALAAFYGVAAAELLGRPALPDKPEVIRRIVVIDTVRLRESARWRVADNFVEGVQRARSQRRRRLVTMRARDLPRLAAVHQLTDADFLAALHQDGVLLSRPVGPARPLRPARPRGLARPVH